MEDKRQERLAHGRHPVTSATPGPWQVWDAIENNTAKLHVGIVTNRGKVRLASLPNMSAIGEDHANASLIAAAPEMLEALEGATQYLHDLWQSSAAMPAAESDVYQIMKAAIRKARQ